MKVVWMGQDGLLFVSGKDKIVVDPYLTNDMQKEDRGFRRAMKINKKFFRINPNIIILTSSAPDHTDIGTLTRYIYKSKNLITIICCAKAYDVIKEADMPRRYNIVVFEEGSEWTYKEMNISAVKSKSNDTSGFGVLLTDGRENKKYYIASATRYNRAIFDDLPDDIDTAFLPINGFSGAMNIYDAKRFAERINAKNIVPVHYGMFDSINPEDFDVPNKIIPQIYKVINLVNAENKKDIALDKKFNESIPDDKKESKKDSKKGKKGDTGDDVLLLISSDEAKITDGKEEPKEASETTIEVPKEASETIIEELKETTEIAKEEPEKEIKEEPEEKTEDRTETPPLTEAESDISTTLPEKSETEVSDDTVPSSPEAETEVSDGPVPSSPEAETEVNDSPAPAPVENETEKNISPTVKEDSDVFLHAPHITPIYEFSTEEAVKTEEPSYYDAYEGLNSIPSAETPLAPIIEQYAEPEPQTETEDEEFEYPNETEEYNEEIDELSYEPEIFIDETDEDEDLFDEDEPEFELSFDAPEETDDFDDIGNLDDIEEIDDFEDVDNLDDLDDFDNLDDIPTDEDEDFDEFDEPVVYKDDFDEEDDDIARKLDAYMEEIEKFQNGGTADFGKIDGNN